MLRRTKILTTLGPATDNPKVLGEMLRAGADVVRVNFSHGEAAAHANRVKMVREVAEQVGKWVAVLGDLQGPKIRIDRFVEGKVMLIEGEPFVLDVSLDSKAGTVKSVGVAYKNLPKDVRGGDTLLLNDGLIVLEVIDVDGPRIMTKVVVGGELSDNKGINKQGGGLTAGALTDKDREHIKLAAELGVDYLAVSFARDGHDMEEARQLLRGGRWSRSPGREDRAQRSAGEPRSHHQSQRRRHGGAWRSGRRSRLRRADGPAETHHCRVP